MGSLFRNKKSLERYEAYTVLAEGCRYLARTCITRGASKIVRGLAEQFDREAAELQDLSLPTGGNSGIRSSKRIPARSH